jgi:hypothetical protein
LEFKGELAASLESEKPFPAIDASQKRFSFEQLGLGKQRLSPTSNLFDDDI